MILPLKKKYLMEINQPMSVKAKIIGRKLLMGVKAKRRKMKGVKQSLGVLINCMINLLYSLFIYLFI